MGTQNISIAHEPEARKQFLKHLLRDIQALEMMFEKGMLEKNKNRMGAEQEFCLVNSYFKPSKIGPRILEMINEPHFTTELARYNLELNLNPLDLEPGCFYAMEASLQKNLSLAEEKAASVGEKVILAGILPSIDYQSVQINNITPRVRYKALADILKTLRGGDFELNITGVDELIISHSNILFEACNTSFQCHFQVDPDEFVDLYNWSQAIAGPVLAVCANSPLLLGKQLWAETRIPLFQQSIDTRGKGFHLRERQQRVTFGNKWIKHPMDVYKSDIARHTVLFLTDIEQDSVTMLNNGEMPKLEALNLHNGTVYKWNRPCYGVKDGIAHIRIENRYIPSGPTIRDEMANMAFWVGLMKSMPDHYKNIWEVMSFDNARENFNKAAMWGIQSGMVWNKKPIATRDLIQHILLPMAKTGLQKMNISNEEIDTYLNVIEARASSFQTGSRWTIKSFRNLKKKLSRTESTVALTALLHERRLTGKPVHEWEIGQPDEINHIEFHVETVSNVMTTDLITVTEHDLAELVLHIMNWRAIRHLPVEGSDGKLLGIIYKKDLESQLNENDLKTVKDVMVQDTISVSPDMHIRQALRMMDNSKSSCLAVCDNNRLVGLITDTDAKRIKATLDKKKDR